jgi:hypothetical protein
VDLPELLVITGRACTRIMSGYQKGKADEAKILESLREEGLLAMPKGKTAGGLSFEVVDANVVFDSKPDNDTEGDIFVSSQFIPSKTLARLELRRGVILILIDLQFTFLEPFLLVDQIFNLQTNHFTSMDLENVSRLTLKGKTS